MAPMLGPMGRGGARRRTRRRMMVLHRSMSKQQQAEIEKAKGKSVDNMTDEELEAEMKKRGIPVTKEEKEVEE